MMHGVCSDVNAGGITFLQGENCFEFVEQAHRIAQAKASDDRARVRSSIRNRARRTTGDAVPRTSDVEEKKATVIQC